MLDRGLGRSRRLFEIKVTVAPSNRNTEMEAKANMTWTTPIITEICIGMEVTSYISAEI